MSRGSRIVNVRFEDELFRLTILAVGRVNMKRRGEPFTLSDFIRKCVEDKLLHMERGKRKKGIDKVGRPLV